MRVVLDTNVIVTAMRRPGGASGALLLEAVAGRVEALATAALCFEYEAVCRRPEHLAAAGFSPADADVFLDAVIDLVTPVDVAFRWRPQLNDPGDEMVLEAAVNGQASSIVSFNLRHYRPATRFGLRVETPSDALRRLLQERGSR